MAAQSDTDSARLAQIELSMARIQHSIADLEQELNRLGVEKQAIVARATCTTNSDVDSSSLATTNIAGDIPSDILIQIFQLLAPSAETMSPICYYSCQHKLTDTSPMPMPTPFPLNVSHVCCAWRASALATRELWSCIRLHIHASIRIHGDSYRDSRNALTAAVLSGGLQFDLSSERSTGGQGALQLLKLYLGRAIDLDVRILVAEWATSSWYSPPASKHSMVAQDDIEDEGEGSDDENCTLSAFNLLLRRSSCWLRCEMPYPALCVLEHLQSGAGQQDGAFPRLSALTIPDMQSYTSLDRPRLSPPLKLFQHVPALRKLSIHTLGPDEIVLPWAQLTTVSLMDYPLSDTLSVLRQTPNIIRLKILSTYHSSSADDAVPGSFAEAPVTLFRLRALLLYSSSRRLLDSLTLPNMHELDLCSLPGFWTLSSLARLQERSEKCYYTTNYCGEWDEGERLSRANGELLGSVAPSLFPYSGITDLHISLKQESKTLFDILQRFPRLASLTVSEDVGRLSTRDTLSWYDRGNWGAWGSDVDGMATNPYNVFLSGMSVAQAPNTDSDTSWANGSGYTEPEPDWEYASAAPPWLYPSVGQSRSLMVRSLPPFGTWVSRRRLLLVRRCQTGILTINREIWCRNRRFAEGIRHVIVNATFPPPPRSAAYPQSSAKPIAVEHKPKQIVAQGAWKGWGMGERTRRDLRTGIKSDSRVAENHVTCHWRQGNADADVAGEGDGKEDVGRQGSQGTPRWVGRGGMLYKSWPTGWVLEKGNGRKAGGDLAGPAVLSLAARSAGVASASASECRLPSRCLTIPTHQRLPGRRQRAQPSEMCEGHGPGDFGVGVGNTGIGICRELLAFAVRMEREARMLCGSTSDLLESVQSEKNERNPRIFTNIPDTCLYPPSQPQRSQGPGIFSKMFQMARYHCCQIFRGNGSVFVEIFKILWGQKDSGMEILTKWHMGNHIIISDNPPAKPLSHGSTKPTRWLPPWLLVPKLRKLTLNGCTQGIDVRRLQAFIQARVETTTDLPLELEVEIVYARQSASDCCGYADVQEAESIRKLKEILRSDAGSGVKLTADYVPKRWDASLDRQMIEELRE
ncbi:hypothetical protein C8F01DRAFT_1225816 [Mycena amicta]|nr:hypothetical protein C8F01DRAFT_1225816 [Mycena amicta]